MTGAGFQRLLAPPKGSFFVFGARGTGKSTWLRRCFPGVTYIDLLDERLYQSYLADVGAFARRLEALPLLREFLDEVEQDRLFDS